MNYRNYISTCIENNDYEELLLSWGYLNKKIANNELKVYNKDSLYVIESASNPLLNNKLFWCRNDYIGNINWDTIQIIGDNLPQTILENGITTNCFEYIDYTLDISQYDNILNQNPNHIPFEKYNNHEDSILNISDVDYYRITKVIGQPFITDDELEYSKNAIIKLSIEPALKEYWKYYPLEDEQVIQLNTGVGFDILIPEGAFNAITWTSRKSLGQKSLYSPASVFAGCIGISSSRTYGISYNKPVPGYTGRGNQISRTASYLDDATLINTLRNFTAKERTNILRKPDGLHLIGYSNMGATLNVIWLKESKNFSDVAFEDYNDVIKFCQASVKADFGAIRSLLKSDNNIPLDTSRLIQDGEKERSDILNKWSSSPWRLRYAISKGNWLPGGN